MLLKEYRSWEEAENQYWNLVKSFAKTSTKVGREERFDDAENAAMVLMTQKLKPNAGGKR